MEVYKRTSYPVLQATMTAVFDNPFYLAPKDPCDGPEPQKPSASSRAIDILKSSDSEDHDVSFQNVFVTKSDELEKFVDQSRLGPEVCGCISVLYIAVADTRFNCQKKRRDHVLEASDRL